jgi:hypothetical protein
MSRLIHQRYDSDCSIAALAMYLGKAYEEIIHYYSMEEQQQDGVWAERTFRVAAQYGVEFFTCTGDQFDRHQKALVVVPSRNHVPDGKHMIYWDGCRVYDPSPIRPYTELPDEVEYAFQEEADKVVKTA